MNSVNVMVTSVGRRNYLVNWFQDAAVAVGTDVHVFTADSDPSAPAMGTGSGIIVLPRIDAPGYADAILEACSERNIHLLFSVNDYDVAMLSRHARKRLMAAGVKTVVPPTTTLDVVEDKLCVLEVFREAGISAPDTVVASGFTQPDSGELDKRWVVKHRYGSGSSGLCIVEGHMIGHAIALSAATAPGPSGVRPRKPNLEYVVVQELVEGEEYGIDVICSFDGAFQGVLARKKLRMRAGETDQAITVDPAPFTPIGRALSATLRLSGTSDVDIIVQPDGTQIVIDINPRFGGGYPFSHLAGANIPACYLAWTLGAAIDPAWLASENGIRGGKYGAIRTITT